MSPSERSFMLLLFTETSRNTIWHSPALIVSNKWASSPSLTGQAMCDIMSSEFNGCWRKKSLKYDLQGSGDCCLDLVKDVKKPIAIITKFSFSQIWRQESKFSTSATTLIPHSTPTFYPASQSGPHGWVTTSKWSIFMSSLCLCLFIPQRHQLFKSCISF